MPRINGAYFFMAHNSTIGNFGENLAILYLKRKGYVVLEKNLRIRHKEIDILAKIKEKLVVIEVKTRMKNSEKYLEDVLNDRKIINLNLAIVEYLLNKYSELPEVQFDLIQIEINQRTKLAKIKHFYNIL